MADPGDGQAVSGACHSVMGAGLRDGCGDTAWGRGRAWGTGVTSSLGWASWVGSLG